MVIRPIEETLPEGTEDLFDDYTLKWRVNYPLYNLKQNTNTLNTIGGIKYGRFVKPVIK